MDFDFISDPNSFAGKVVTGVVVKLTTNMIEAASGKVAKRFKDEPSQKALEGVLSKSLARALEHREDLNESDEAHLQRYFEHEDVLDELWHLLEGQEPDFEALENIYNEHFGETSLFPDLRSSMIDLTISFLDLATRDEVLQPIMGVRIARESLLVQKESLTIQQKMLLLMSKPGQSAMERYLFHLYKQCENLQLSSMGDTEKNQKTISLDDVFIPLNTTSQVGHFDARGKDLNTRKGEEAFLATHKEKPLPALEALRKARRMVLLGDPGSGKSTFVKHLCAAQAPALVQQGQPVLDLPDDNLPILIILREIAGAFVALAARSLGEKDYDDALLKLTEDYFAGQNWSKDFAHTLQQDYLEKGRCLLIFDGLDEVPFASRAAVRQGVEACLRIYQPRMLVVTCRIHAYAEGQQFENLEDFTLAPLNEEQIDGFIQKWYDGRVALGRESRVEANSRIKDLEQAVRGEGVADMAENPMLLTTLTLLHQRDTRLPDQRVTLYARAIKIMIEDWQQAKSHIPENLQDIFRQENILRSILQELAWEAHQSGDRDSDFDLPRETALKVLKKQLGNLDLALKFLDYVDQKAGLFIGKGGGSDLAVAYGFAHRTFQEYLAGCRLVTNNRSLKKDILELLKKPSEWELAIQLGLEEMRYNQTGQNALLDLAYLLVRNTLPNPANRRRGVVLAGEIIRLVGLKTVKTDDDYEEGWLERLGDFLDRLLVADDFPARDRCQAGVKLGHLGDTRPAVLVVDQMEVALIPPGPFWMGSPDSDEMRSKDEKLHRNEALNYPYWLSRFPISNAQFRTFVDEKGYADQRWWVEAQEAGYWNPKGIKVSRDEKERTAPADFGHPFSLPNHPVVGISWYEMLAFCHWLTSRWQSKGWLPENWEVLLPSEAEWEKGARGGLQLPEEPIIRGIDQGIVVQRADLPKGNPQPQRRYPWGEDPDPERMNFGDTRIKGSSALGAFPGGASPYGLEEISGNVWEWTRSLIKDFPYNPVDGREELNVDDLRVLRGGSFSSNGRYARCACRGYNVPSSRLNYFGFRIVCVPKSVSGR